MRNRTDDTALLIAAIIAIVIAGGTSCRKQETRVQEPSTASSAPITQKQTGDLTERASTIEIPPSARTSVAQSAASNMRWSSQSNTAVMTTSARPFSLIGDVQATGILVATPLDACTPTRNAPCEPPDGTIVLKMSGMLVPVRYGGVGRKPWHWLWIKDGEASRPCNAEERIVYGRNAIDACDAQVGSVVAMTAFVKVKTNG